MATSNNDLKELEEPLAKFIGGIANGDIPLHLLFNMQQMKSLYNLLWIEIYEDQQKKERDGERLPT